MSTDINPYDDVPYKSYPYRQTHPDRLATMATLFGLASPPVERCRVLELGCASGGNLMPLADQLPEGQFVGLDLSQKAIDQGQQAITQLGLKNIRLLRMNLLEVAPELGQFDYILAHGVYSWIPDEAQQALMRICSQNLAPNGVAYVSYNTYPGWHMRGMIRDMMYYRARAFESPADRLRHARALIDFLAQAVPSTEDNAYGILLKNELNLIREKEDHYLLHEHLEEVNEPIYFHEFVERAEALGLQYLGEADFRSMAITNFPKEVGAMIQNVSTNTIEIEQYMDFVRNRMFRQTLLCHAHHRLDRAIGADRIAGLYVASPARPEPPEIDVLSTESVSFRGPGSVLTTGDPLVKAAMLALSEAWPGSIPFSQLYSQARSRLRNEPFIADSSSSAPEARKLLEPVIRGYATSQIELSVLSSPFTLEVSDRPEASRLARQQAATSNTLTNRRHEMTRINDLQRHVVGLLDGQRDREGVLDELVAIMRRGVLTVHERGQAVRDETRMREILHQTIDNSLKQLARQCLLVA